MTIFEKMKSLDLIHMLRKVNLYPFFRTLEGSVGNNVKYNGQELVMMGSNNYLGLTHNPVVMQAAIDSIHQWGTGCTGSRFLNGNLSLHEDLEKKLAEFFGTENSIVFATGFMANQGAISGLVGPGDYIFSDEENHACIIEGCRLSGAKIVVFRHGDMAHLEEQLKTVSPDAGKLIITDGVFSMTGRIAKYDQIYALAKKYGAQTYIDDAHGLGVVGVGGRGTASHFNLPADIIMGTFSKSLASQGGYIAGSNELIDWLRHKARTFMFSAALAPSSSAAALKALEVLIERPEMVEDTRKNAMYLKAKFDALGLNTMNTETCIIPVFIGDDQTALVVCQQLLKLGVFTTPVVYPAVPKGAATIRCSVMATHTAHDLDRAAQAFAAVAPLILKANKNTNQASLHDLLDNGGAKSANLSQINADFQ